MKKPNINDADHPNRQKAIHIIEEVIEPLLYAFKNENADDGLNDDEYYKVEDEIVNILNKKFNL